MVTHSDEALALRPFKGCLHVMTPRDMRAVQALHEAPAEAGQAEDNPIAHEAILPQDILHVR